MKKGAFQYLSADILKLFEVRDAFIHFLMYRDCKRVYNVICTINTKLLLVAL